MTTHSSPATPRPAGPGWTLAPVPVAHPEAVAVLRVYIEELAERFYGRPATEQEIEDALVKEPSDDLAPPGGVFLLARSADGAVSGCVGVRLIGARVAELKRVFVHPHARGRGGGALLLEAAEGAARELGADVLRLDTRGDLVEARALYARHGYREIPAYNEGPYAEHWYEKRLPTA
ncbi:GNAT family N-acetyltransferase [Streptomyces sp. N2-109]|uniref:GNAT family N-acetyltransferase n=1 Tax=Streptomyces gossypii TaxID=2883101 RepID=A0ABT2K0I2_9ACTN|nr:GNAT family N-acetyltransferase [Streptomyces gossypii]MCT2593050.1 GNAT family N-acetyltransferase [Streptomyces gossypii]